MFDADNLILRLPENIALSLNKDINNEKKLEEHLFINLDPTSRNCHIKYRNQRLNATLVNLPNEVCCLKTTNNETFTNLLPVKHMILANEELSYRSKPYNDDFTMKHGLAPPLKNVNTVKFRKPKKKINKQMMEIIKDMLNSDENAESVWYKMLEESDNEDDEKRDIDYIVTQCQQSQRKRDIKIEEQTENNSSDYSSDSTESDDSENCSDDFELSLSGDDIDFNSSDTSSTDDDNFQEIID